MVISLKMFHLRIMRQWSVQQSALHVLYVFYSDDNIVYQMPMLGKWVHPRFFFLRIGRQNMMLAKGGSCEANSFRRSCTLIHVSYFQIPWFPTISEPGLVVGPDLGIKVPREDKLVRMAGVIRESSSSYNLYLSSSGLIMMGA